MPIWLVAENLGYISVDRVLKVQQYKNHVMYANKIFDFSRFFPQLVQTIERAYGSQILALFQEYIATVFNTIIFGFFFYMILCTLNYIYFFKLRKSKYLPKLNGDFKIMYDIKLSMYNMLIESWLVSLLRISLPRHSMVYYDVNDYGWLYLFLSIFLHMCYDETLTYWVHRWLHTFPSLYQLLHKYHHKSLDITPYSGFAFHPIDAFLQALGTFTSSFWFPIHINVIIGFSLATMYWAISIHDNVPMFPFKLFLYSTHHTIHHEAGRGQMMNYGKFTTIWDRIMGSYWDPDRINFGWDEQFSKLKQFSNINNIYSSIVQDKSSCTDPKNPIYNKIVQDKKDN